MSIAKLFIILIRKRQERGIRGKVNLSNGRAPSGFNEIISRRTFDWNIDFWEDLSWGLWV